MFTARYGGGNKLCVTVHPALRIYCIILWVVTSNAVTLTKPDTSLLFSNTELLFTFLYNMAVE